MPLRRPRARALRPLAPLPGQQYPLPHKHTPDQHSYLAFLPSPTSLRAVPRTPLSPPLRLHLYRPLLSLSLPYHYIDTAPGIPSPWRWRCHKCGSVYKVGVTRRCLDDGHLFCSVPPEIPRSDDSHHIEDEVADLEDESFYGSGADDFLSAKRRQMRNMKRRRQKACHQRRRAVGCGSEFDYDGWEEYNEWRRYVRRWMHEYGATPKRKYGHHGQERDEFEGKTRKNCWEDCAFPSECHHQRVKEMYGQKHIQALSEREEMTLAESVVESPSSVAEDCGGEREEEAIHYQDKVMDNEDWVRKLQRGKVAGFEKAEREAEDLEEFAFAVYGSSTCSSPSTLPSISPPITMASSQSSMARAWDSMDMVGIERRDLDDEAQMVDIALDLTSSSLSSDGIDLEDVEMYGLEFATKLHQKNVQKIAQIRGQMLDIEAFNRGYEEKARSPLKESFTIEDIQEDDINLADEEKETVEEEERGGFVHTRRVGRGENGEFGDGQEMQL